MLQSWSSPLSTAGHITLCQNGVQTSLLIIFSSMFLIQAPYRFNPDAAPYGFGSWPGHLAHNPYNDEVEPYTGRLEGKDYLRDIQLAHMRTLARDYETDIIVRCCLNNYVISYGADMQIVVRYWWSKFDRSVCSGMVPFCRISRATSGHEQSCVYASSFHQPHSHRSFRMD